MRYKIDRLEDFLDIPEEKIEEAIDQVKVSILLWYKLAKKIQKFCAGEVKNEVMKLTIPTIEYCDDGKREIHIFERKDIA